MTETEDKWKKKTELLYRWIRFEQTGVSISDLIRERGYETIALYGYNEIARCFIYEADRGDYSVKCVIDRKGGAIPIDFPICTPEEFSDEGIDAVVVMIINAEDICEYLRARVKCDVISVEELLYEL